MNETELDFEMAITDKQAWNSHRIEPKYIPRDHVRHKSRSYENSKLPVVNWQNCGQVWLQQERKDGGIDFFRLFCGDRENCRYCRDHWEDTIKKRIRGVDAVGVIVVRVDKAQRQKLMKSLTNLRQNHPSCQHFLLTSPQDWQFAEISIYVNSVDSYLYTLIAIRNNYLPILHKQEFGSHQDFYQSVSQVLHDFVDKQWPVAMRVVSVSHNFFVRVIREVKKKSGYAFRRACCFGKASLLKAIIALDQTRFCADIVGKSHFHLRLLCEDELSPGTPLVITAASIL